MRGKTAIFWGCWVIVLGMFWGITVEANMYDDANGNIGIGTTAPVGRLDVYVADQLPSGNDISTGKSVSANYSPGFGTASLITNGTYASDGTAWNNSTYAVQLNTAGTGCTLTIDLGQVFAGINRVRVQVDNNDIYTVEHSTNNSDWTTLYTTSTGGAGLVTRDSDSLSAVSARYIRIYAISGDGFYSVSEVQVFGGTTSSTCLIVTSSGYVGIGTTAPANTLHVLGTCYATKFTDGGSGYDFYMPNPVCPDEEMLRHWAIETDGLKTIYSGNAQTDDTSECIVTMPYWFVPLNDISTCAYSLTSLSGLGQVAVKEKMNRQGEFVVVSQQPNQEFSWTIIVYRGDALGVQTMQENPIVEKRR